MKIELCIRKSDPEGCWWSPVRATGRWRIEVNNDAPIPWPAKLYLEIEKDRRFLWMRWTSREWVNESLLRVMYTETFTNECQCRNTLKKK